MFYGCTALTSFECDLSSIQYAGADGVMDPYGMFQGCTSLTSFNSDLSSLIDGEDMFTGCKLDKTSVERIVNSLPTHTDGWNHLIAIGCDANEVSQSDVSTYESTLTAKGWTATFSRN